MALRLTAAAGVLPLGFEVGERLAGQRPEPYRLNGELPATGRRLAAALDREGQGPHRITIHGRYVPEDAAGPLGDLKPWSRTVTVLGRLDPALLGRIAHEVCRAFITAHTGPTGGTPPEVYVTGLDVGRPAPAARKPPTPRRRKPRRIGTFTRYRDTTTGQLVSEATWRRSKAALRGHAKGGRPKAGRYVREQGPIYERRA